MLGTPLTRKQHEAHRRRQGIPPKTVSTWEERQQRNEREHQERWNEEYRGVWGKLPGETLTAGEFQNRYPAFRKWVRECQGRGNRLYWAVDFVREHHGQERRRERDEWLSLDDDPPHQAAERRKAQQKHPDFQYWIPPHEPLEDETPRVGRNQPYPCGSGRKFKKCCGP